MTATKRRLTQRRAINQRLGQQDRANRCSYCLAALGATFYKSLTLAGKFCSDACLASALEQDARQEER